MRERGTSRRRSVRRRAARGDIGKFVEMPARVQVGLAAPKRLGQNAHAMRLLAPLLPLTILLVCQCNASVTTTGSSSGPSTAPATPPATPAAAVKPPRPTTKAGCDACKGQWARHGISETESCICKAKDAGKACKDGSECEGACLLTDDAKFEVAAPGPPPRGSFTGKCSDYDAVFGCFRLIASGTRAKGPVAEDEAAQRLCID